MVTPHNLLDTTVQFLLNLSVQTRELYRAKEIWCGCISRATATPPLSTRGSRLPLKQVCDFPFNVVRNIHCRSYNVSSDSLVNKLVYRAFSHDVTTAILGSAILRSETNSEEFWGSWHFYVIYHTRDSVSSGYPNTEKRVEKRTRSWVFLMIADETLSRVFDMSSQTKQKLRSKRRSKIIKIYAN